VIGKGRGHGKHVLKLAFNLSVFSNLISKDQVKDVMFLVQGHFEK
jgi:hypothetical protein